MRAQTLVVPILLTLALVPGAAQAQDKGAPETFSANAQATGATGGAAAATIIVDIRRYTPDADRTAVENALKTGGYPGFVTALRKAPEVGTVTAGGEKFTIRYARERKSGEHARTIDVVTDQPMFFVGGGKVDAKSRAGYEVAVVHLEVDDVGLGRGSMAAAARVKPGEGAVQIDDYADKMIKLVTVVRKPQ